MNVSQTEQTYSRIRYLAMYDESPLARHFRDLDEHLSAGGTPPEAWREGPDAPATDDDTVTIRYVIHPEYRRGEVTVPAYLASVPALAVALAVTGNRANERFISADVIR